MLEAAGEKRRSGLSNFRKALWRVFRLVALAYVCLIVFMYFYQRQVQYFPDSRSPVVPDAKRFEGIEEFTTITSDGIEIEGWYWPGERPVTLVVFHGNAGNRASRLGWLLRLRRGLDVHLCIVDYRGYGGSGGSPTEDGLYLDAVSTMEWLRQRGAPPAIYVGESLGTGVAVELARRDPPLGVILQSGYTSCVDVAQTVYPFLPVSLLMKDRFDNASKMDEVRCPVLVIHGDSDDIIPFEIGKALFDAAREPKEWFPISGGDHNQLLRFMGEEYIERLDVFIQRCLAASVTPSEAITPAKTVTPSKRGTSTP